MFMNDSILINQLDILHVVPYDEILYCQADRGYCYIHLVAGESILISKTLACLTTEMNGNFLRISQSLLVNKKFIRKVLKKEKAMVLGTGIKLSFTYKYEQIINQLKD